MGKFFQSMACAAAVTVLVASGSASAIQSKGVTCNIPKLDKILAGHLTPTGRIKQDYLTDMGVVNSYSNNRRKRTIIFRSYKIPGVGQVEEHYLTRFKPRKEEKNGVELDIYDSKLFPYKVVVNNVPFSNPRRGIDGDETAIVKDYSTCKAFTSFK